MKITPFIFALIFSSFAFSQSLYFPPTDGSTTWETTDPSTLGWCEDSINSLYDMLDTEETDAFIVLKDGKIVLENYFGSYTEDSLHYWFSAAKSLRAVLVGIAQQEGFININNKTSDYLGSGWTSLTQEQEDSITVWHQLTMTTGLNDNNFSCVDPSCLNYLATAGSRWAYHNGPYNLTRDVVENTSGLGDNNFTNQYLKNPIGMDGFWINLAGSSFFRSKARDMARFGLLMQNEGIWGATPVLSDTTYFDAMVNSSQTINPAYGYFWWLNGKSSFIPPGSQISFPFPISPNAPSDVIVAAGSQGQFVSISSSLGLIMIRQGQSSSSSLTEFQLHDGIWKKLMTLECGIGIDEVKSTDFVQIYPNPTSNTVYFSLQNEEDFQGKVLSMDGKEVFHFENQPSIDMGKLEQGCYFIHVQQDDHNRIFRVEVR